LESYSANIGRCIGNARSDAPGPTLGPTLGELIGMALGALLAELGLPLGSYSNIGTCTWERSGRMHLDRPRSGTRRGAALAQY
jgi:hypothetical protein